MPRCAQVELLGYIHGLCMGLSSMLQCVGRRNSWSISAQVFLMVWRLELLRLVNVMVADNIHHGS